VLTVARAGGGRHQCAVVLHDLGVAASVCDRRCCSATATSSQAAPRDVLTRIAARRFGIESSSLATDGVPVVVPRALAP
jgi:ABC-type hemin transport system ATPase subunit